MTNPQLIRVLEARSQRPGMDRRVLLVTEGRDRSSGRGDRFLLVLAYGFVISAMCLLLSDFCRLLLNPDVSQNMFR